jgi:CubicO group peptidase (beta-lactamase class C family)
MNKKSFQLFLATCFLCPILHSQSIQEQINTVKENHDLMGGVVVTFCEQGIKESIPFGLADFQRNIPVSDTTQFRIASISKTVTAMAAMKLHEQGALDLDMNISQILGFPIRNPNFPDVPITTRMLLSHTSTLIDGSSYSNFLNATYGQNPMPNISELLSTDGTYYASNQFVNVRPGSYFSYSNINFGILGTIIEKVSNTRFDIYVREQILEPLGITGSFNVNDININQLAVLYRKTNGSWIPQADNYQGIQPVFTNIEGYVPGTNGLRFAPQGGLRCSGNDLSKIFLLLLNKGAQNGVRVLEEVTVNEMVSPVWDYNGTNGNNYYGLFRGWGLGIHRSSDTPNNDIVLSGSSRMLGHPGEAYGLVSDAYVDTTRRFGFVFMTNGSGTGYSTNSQSVFYTVEQDIFDAVESYAAITDCTVSANNIVKHEDLGSVFPNPTHRFVNLPLINHSFPIQYTVYDSFGRILLTGTALHNRAIDIENLPVGIYLLKINDVTNTVFKVVKQ